MKAAFALGFALFSFLWWYSPWYHVRSVDIIPIEDMDWERFSFEEVALIEGAARHWEAVNFWAIEKSSDPLYSPSCSFLGNLVALPPTLNMSISPIASFSYLQKERPLYNVLNMSTYQIDAPTIKEVPREHLCNQNRSNFVYFSERLNQLPTVLSKDLQHKEWFIHGTYNISDQKNILWIGSKGVTTKLHYDWSYNFHVVIRGQKRFDLYPPKDAWELHLYPYLHPRATKSQIAFQDDSWPSSTLHPYSVVVKEGDILFIPPLWFHEVYSLEPSISVSMWTPCPETDIVNDMISRGFPLPVQFKGNRKLAMFSFLYELLSLLGDGNSGPVYPYEFMKKLLRSRYVPLFDVHPEMAPFRLGVPLLCPNDISLQKDMIIYYQSEVPFLAGLWLQIPFERREIWLADFVEISLLSVASSPLHIPTLIQCFLLLYV